MEFNELQKLIFEEYKKNGYLDSWTNKDNQFEQLKYDLAELGLITTEISEAMEFVRDGSVETVGLSWELADILIRTLNFCSRIGFNNMEGIILSKHHKNIKRKKLHGRKV